MRIIMPLILIAISLTIFFVLANPLYNEISKLQAEAVDYNDALGNSKMLENERDKLTAKYNAINPENLKKLEKLLPDNVDNIRLILEIEKIASPYGMTLKNVKYNTDEEKTEGVGEDGEKGFETQRGIYKPVDNKEYGTFDLEFTTSASYNNFINFTRDLENNLRIVDIASIDFSSDVTSANSDVYQYNYKIKTYWLRN